MFTGIIEETGKVIGIQKGDFGARIKIAADAVLEGTKEGDSICVNGVCLTVTSIKDREFTADIMNETLRRSSLGKLQNADSVNLERAMAADGRFGGHIVTGHIDGTGTVSSVQKEGNATWIYIKAPREILNLIVEKGSVALDGISLTVAKVSDADFAVSIIPHTGEHTTLLEKNIGDAVNIENDIVAKYVQKILGTGANLFTSKTDSAQNNNSNITEDFLRERGF